MEMLELNETPVRTARNFKINSIQLENVEIPESVKTIKTYALYYSEAEDIELPEQ